MTTELSEKEIDELLDGDCLCGGDDGPCCSHADRADELLMLCRLFRRRADGYESNWMKERKLIEDARAVLAGSKEVSDDD